MTVNSGVWFQGNQVSELPFFIIVFDYKAWLLQLNPNFFDKIIGQAFAYGAVLTTEGCGYSNKIERRKVIEIIEYSNM